MSHYSWDADEIPSYFVTNYVIHDRMSRRTSGQFFTNIAATCTGWLPNESQRQEFWGSVAFYDYIQQFVGNYQAAPCRRVVGVLACGIQSRSSGIEAATDLVIGVTNWNNISKSMAVQGSLSQVLRSLNMRRRTGIQLRANARALAFHLKHTSAGYNFRKFAPLCFSGQTSESRGIRTLGRRGDVQKVYRAD